MTKLFEPLKINGMQIKNRFVRSATMDHFAQDGMVSEKEISLYSELAKGEVGLIISHGLCPSPNGWVSTGQLCIDREETIPSLGQTDPGPFTTMTGRSPPRSCTGDGSAIRPSRAARSSGPRPWSTRPMATKRGNWQVTKLQNWWRTISRRAGGPSRRVSTPCSSTAPTGLVPEHFPVPGNQPAAGRMGRLHRQAGKFYAEGDGRAPQDCRARLSYLHQDGIEGLSPQRAVRRLRPSRSPSSSRQAAWTLSN